MPSYNIALDFANQSITNTGITIKRMDGGTNEFIFSLSENREVYNLNEKEVCLRFKFSDGTSNETERFKITEETPIFTYLLQCEDICVKGITYAELSVYEGDARLTTGTFRFGIAADIDVNEDIEKDRRFPIIERLLQELRASISEAQKCENNITEYEKRIQIAENKCADLILNVEKLIKDNAETKGKLDTAKENAETAVKNINNELSALKELSDKISSMRDKACAAEEKYTSAEVAIGKIDDLISVISKKAAQAAADAQSAANGASEAIQAYKEIKEDVTATKQAAISAQDSALAAQQSKETAAAKATEAATHTDNAARYANEMKRTSNGKANADLSNVTDVDFKNKIDEVFPDGIGGGIANSITYKIGFEDEIDTYYGSATSDYDMVSEPVLYKIVGKERPSEDSASVDYFTAYYLLVFYSTDGTTVGQMVNQFKWRASGLWRRTLYFHMSGKPLEWSEWEEYGSGGGSIDTSGLAKKDLSNVTNEDFAEKFNEVFPDGVGGGDGEVDLSEYKFIGETPQNVMTACESVVLECEGGGTYDVKSFTIADLDNSQTSISNTCSEIKKDGIYYLTVNSDEAWYKHKKNIYIDSLEAGVKYRLVIDMRYIDINIFTSDCDVVAYVAIADTNASGDILKTHTITRADILNDGLIKIAFTTISDKTLIVLQPTTSGNTVINGTTLAYRDIWVNCTDADYVGHTEIYNVSGSFSTSTHELKNIPKNVTVSTNPNGNIYVLADTIPKSRLSGKTCVCFGDSITGNYTEPYDYPYLIGEATGMTVINGGFGGCRMASHPTSDYDAFSMYRLADSIVTGDWSLQDAAVSKVSSPNAQKHLTALRAVNWSEVDFITIFYGANDFTGSVTLDNPDNPLDTNCYSGALRYSIERILTAFPQIRLVILSPTYRIWRDTGEDGDSKTINDKKIMDFVYSTVSTAMEYKVSSMDMYSTLGINRITQNIFLSDGGHPTSIGLERIANTISARLVEL